VWYWTGNDVSFFGNDLTDGARLVAMTFGRPIMISRPGNVPVPSLIDDEYLSDNGEDGAQPADVPSRLGLFISSCKLFELLADILECFYVDNSETGIARNLESKTRGKDMLADALDFNRRLDKFAESIPEYLQTSEISELLISEQNSCGSLQQQVLYCRCAEPRSFPLHLSSNPPRFLNVRLLSLRPLLLSVTNQSMQKSVQPSKCGTKTSLDKELADKCCNLCVAIAHRLIEIIHRHLNTAYKSSGWHSVYCKSNVPNCSPSG
jgi:hypothetical protein